MHGIKTALLVIAAAVALVAASPALQHALHGLSRHGQWAAIAALIGAAAGAQILVSSTGRRRAVRVSGAGQRRTSWPQR